MPYLLSAIAALGGLLFGYDTGIIAGALLLVQKKYALSTLSKEYLVSSLVLMALVGALISGQLSRFYGRRTLLRFASLGFMLGSLLCSLAWSPLILIIGRAIVGFSIGISAYVVPLFIAEMAPTERRGSLVLFNGVAITGGQVLAFTISYCLMDSGSWRALFATSFIPASLLFIGLCFVPDTPRSIALKGRVKEAKHILQRIRGTTEIEPEWQEILHTLMTKQSSWRDLFQTGTPKMLGVGLGLGTLQQFCGINTVMYYGPFLFSAAGFQEVHTQMLATLIMGTVNTLITIALLFTVDRLGRRSLLLSGTLLAALSLISITILISYYPLAHALILLLMMSYIAGYALSLGSLFWLIIAEIYPLHLRAQAMSFVTAIQWLANFLVSISFLSILNGLGASRTFALYASICLVAALFSYFFVPETRTLSLESLEKKLLS